MTVVAPMYAILNMFNIAKRYALSDRYQRIGEKFIVFYFTTHLTNLKVTSSELNRVSCETVLTFTRSMPIAEEFLNMFRGLIWNLLPNRCSHIVWSSNSQSSNL